MRVAKVIDYKNKTAGFVHTTLLVLLVLLATALSFTVLTNYKDTLNKEETSDKETVAGLSTPNSQIASIPKADCDIFVSNTGNDANTGTTESAPLKKIQTAANKVQTGQAVCIKGGEYREVVEIRNKHGTAQNPIKIGGYVGGGLPIVSGGITNGDEYMLPDPQCKVNDVCNEEVLDSGKCKNRHICIRSFLFNVLESSHIRIYGIDVRGSSGRGFGVSESNDVYVRGVRTYHNWSQGFQFNADMPGKGNNMFAEYIAVYDNIRAMSEKNLIGGGAIHVNKIKGGYIRNSLVFENFGEGLDVHKGTSNFVVAKNMFWDNFHASLYANGSTNATLDANLLFCTKNRVDWLEENGVKPGKDTGYGAALTLRNEEIVTSQHGEGGGTIASNNLLLGCTGNIIIAAQGNAKLDDVAVFNNTIVSPRDFPANGNYEGKPGEGISLSGKAGSLQNIHVENNIILADSTGDSISGKAMGSDQITYINNIVSKPPEIARDGIRVADPMLKNNVETEEVLNPATISASDYVINEASPAVGAGTKPTNARNLIERDFFGNTRGNNPIDLGAFEIGNSADWSNLYLAIMQGTGSVGSGEEPPAPVVVNWLKNGAFEESAAGSGEIARYWTPGNIVDGQVRYSLLDATTSEFSSGKKLFIEILKTPTASTQVSQNDVILSPNTFYKLSFSGKSIGKGSRVFIEFYELGSVNKKVALRKAVVLRPDWRKFNLNVRTRSFDPSKKVKFVIQVYAPVNNKIELDNFELKLAE